MPISSPRGKRRIRRASLSSRITGIPWSLYFAFFEFINSIDWNTIPHSVPRSIGSASCLILFITRVISCTLLAPETEETVLFNKNKQQALLSSKKRWRDNDIFIDEPLGRRSPLSLFGAVGFLLRNMILLLPFLLVAASIGNALYCFLSTRQYQLLSHSADQTVKSESARKARMRFDQDNGTDEDGNVSSSTTGSPFTDRIKQLVSFNKRQHSTPVTKVWQLQVWDPPLFGLRIMETFSPLHAIFIYFIEIPASVLGSLSLIGFTCILLSGYLTLFTEKFLQLIEDKQILHKEYSNEYDTRVVRPLTSIPKRDVSVGTDGSVHVYLTNTRTSNFKLANLMPSQHTPPTTPLRPRKSYIQE